jgi:hypothetical protein
MGRGDPAIPLSDTILEKVEALGWHMANKPESNRA